jgi:hypothetical protein
LISTKRGTSKRFAYCPLVALLSFPNKTGVIRANLFSLHAPRLPCIYCGITPFENEQWSSMSSIKKKTSGSLKRHSSINLMQTHYFDYWRLYQNYIMFWWLYLVEWTKICDLTIVFQGLITFYSNKTSVFYVYDNTPISV